MEPRRQPPTARRLGLIGCHVCGLVCRRQESVEEARCPRCDTRLHSRKVDSVKRTWALVIASVILLFPANMLPIMTTRSIFGIQSDTILSGVVYLWKHGSWPLAVLVFFASVMVPLLKLISLTFLLVSVQKRSMWRPGDRTRLYRLIDFVGRWSMLDIFVVALLAALVQVQSVASISPEPGALAFASVVILTIFAAMTFDPKLIWDAVDAPDD